MANRKKINHLNKRSARSSSKQGIFRVIGGQWKGRKLRFIEAEGLRPSLDRVRETLFNWLQADIHGAKCLDLFAGSGAIGIEALSRGAQSTHFIELNREAVAKLEQNLSLLETEKMSVFNQDAFKFLANNTEVFDIIFLDPPFHKGMAQKVCDQLAQASWLNPETIIYLEIEKDASLVLPQNWQVVKGKKTGQLVYKLLRVTENSEEVSKEKNNESSKENKQHKLFSYGTLQNEAVQLETFGRKLEGKKEVLIGYKLSMIKIQDKEVVALSGETHHPILEYTGNDNDQVEGKVFNVSAKELAQADEYEVEDYTRDLVKFKSKTKAWTYIKRANTN